MLMESDGRFYELRVSLNNIPMNAADFRRIALSLEGAEEAPIWVRLISELTEGSSRHSRPRAKVTET
jgi:hypothetical protein